jgi:hypothetical protein
MLKVTNNKTKMVDGSPVKEMKLDVDLVDAQAFLTSKGEDALCMELGRQLMKSITLNKPKV